MSSDRSGLRHALRHPGVRRIVLAEALSGLGDGTFWVGLVAELAHQHSGVLWYALAAIARLGPRALFGAPAGSLADRFDRRRLLVTLDVVRAVTMVALAVAVGLHASAGLLVVLVLVTYSFAAPYRPALTSAVPSVAPERDLGASNALLGTVRQALTFLGPLAGVGLLAIGAPTWAIVVNAITFAVSAMLVRGLPSTSGRRRPTTSTIAMSEHGAADARSTGGATSIAAIVTVVFAMYLLRGAELVMHVYLAADRLGLGARGVGLLAGAIGLGALAAMPLGARIATTDRAAVVLMVTLALNIGPLAALGGVRRPWVAVLLLTIQGATLVGFEVATLVFVQRLTPRGQLGRAFGHVNSASNAGRLVGVLLILATIKSTSFATSLLTLAGVMTALLLGSSAGLLRLQTKASVTRRRLRPVVDVLSGCPLFEGASAAAMERVAETVRVVGVPADHVVIEEGAEADALYLARHGTFSVTVAGAQVNTMSPGDWFGEIGLVHHTARTATVRTTSDAELWRIPGEEFLAALSDSAEAPAAMLDTIAERLARTPLS